jgi:hypothetical protein
MKFLEHDKLVSPNDIVQPIITYTGCSISAIALLISVIISRKFDLTNSIPGNNLENLCVALGLSNVLFMKMHLFLNTLPLSQCLCATVWVSVLHMYTTDIDINAKETSQK